MTVGRTYLDYNASAPLRPEARRAMLAALDAAGNPSSVHAEGRCARALVEKAREQVAALVNARREEVVFTSGGTEANNWVLGEEWESVIVSAVEHDSVLAPARGFNARLSILDADQRGRVNLTRVAALLGRGSAARALVSTQMANNESGVVQEIATVTKLAREHGAATHTDAIQAMGKIPVDFKALGVDFMSLSAHKIGGPKGVGALVVRAGQRLFPWLAGGGQESRRRAGTENVAGIAGFGAAAEAAARDLAGMGKLAGLRDRLESEVKGLTPEAVVVAEASPRLPNTSCIALPGRKAETLVIALDLMGLAVSAGAACSSGKVARSHVLEAMGLGETIASSAIRVSLGWNTTEEDIEAFVAAWASIAARKVPRHAAA